MQHGKAHWLTTLSTLHPNHPPAHCLLLKLCQRNHLQGCAGCGRLKPMETGGTHRGGASHTAQPFLPGNRPWPMAWIVLQPRHLHPLPCALTTKQLAAPTPAPPPQKTPCPTPAGWCARTLSSRALLVRTLITRALRARALSARAPRVRALITCAPASPCSRAPCPAPAARCTCAPGTTSPAPSSALRAQPHQGRMVRQT